MKNLTKVFTIVYVLIFLKRIASGKRVDSRIIVKWYSFADLVFGNGPTQSIMVPLNGSSNAAVVVIQLWV